MQNYLRLAQRVIQQGARRPNRTSVDVTGLFGGELEYDLSAGFPLPSTKFVPFKSVVAELVGFAMGLTSAADFRQLGTKIWDENANENVSWLANPHRKGVDDLGPIYGYQWRRWESIKMVLDCFGTGNAARKAYVADGYEVVGQLPSGDWTATQFLRKEIDQMADLIAGLKADPYGRRHIVTSWNPGVLKEVALPACHNFFQCYVRNGHIDMKMYQRSADVFLGVPFNIASYAALTHVLAALTGLLPGKLTLTFGDLHVYDNHKDALYTQLNRSPGKLPTLKIRPILTFDDLTPEHFDLFHYDPQPAIKAPMANN